MSEWITHAEAQLILGVHQSTVGKLIARGQLDSRGFTGRGRGGLRREQVEALAEERRRTAVAAARRREEQAPKGPPAPPDDGPEWLSVRQVAELLGVTGQTVRNRCSSGRMPSTLRDGRRWVRRDHVEMWARAREAEVRRQP